MNRLEKLQQMFAASPDDETLKYMLAMELDKAGQTEECLTLFSDLMTSQKPYVPAFLMAGQLLARHDRIGEARQTYRRGIENAQQQGDDHAAAEMKAFLSDLPEAD